MGVFISGDAVASDITHESRSADSSAIDRVASAHSIAAHRRLIALLRREPMVHFLLAGALIFGATHAIETYRDRSAHTIVVDAPLRDRLARLYTLQLGNTPTGAQLEQLVDSYVRDEILYREAIALGLDKGDEIVRRRLVQKMGFLQSDLIIAGDPDEATLRAYFAAHPAQFALPATVDFEQRFFDGDSAAAYGRAQQALQQLNGGAAVDGDRAPVAAQYRGLDRIGLSRVFGATPIVDELLQGGTGTWRGPFQSGYGWHLVRVDRRDAPHAPPFDSVRDAVADAVRAQQKEDNNRASFDRLRARYDVRIDTAVAP